MKAILLLLAVLLPYTVQAQGLEVQKFGMKSINPDLIVTETIVPGTAGVDTPIVTSVTINTLMPDSLPIEPGASRAFLLSQVNGAKAWFTGDGINVLPGKPATATATYGSPTELLAKVSNVQITVGITDPVQPIMAHCQLTNGDGNVLFEGEADAVAVANGSEWNIVAKQVTLRSAWSFEIPVSDITAATAIIHDGGSDEIRYDLQLTDDGFIFPSWLRGRQGEIILTHGTGAVAVYSLTNGKRVTKLANGKASATLPSYTEVKADKNTPPLVVGTMIVELVEYETPQAPVFRIEVKDSRKTVRLVTLIRDADGPTGHTPTNWWYFQEGSDYEFGAQPPKTDPKAGTVAVTIVLDPGIYYLYAEDGLFEGPWWSYNQKA